MMKIENGKRRYGNPTQITDLVGFRIVCYLLSDVQKIKSVIEHHFKIDWGNTKYPQDKLKENEIGYRSTNYIVKLSDHLLDEEKDNEKFKELSFEIQVKTLLDFAWQEIQHDRVYKTTIKYPKGEGIERKFILLSGLLEIADNEFDELSKGTDKFDRSLIDKIKEGKLDDISIIPSHLRLYLKDYSDIPGFRPYFGANQDVINELEAMGIKTMKQLDEIVKPNFKEKYKENSETSDHVTLTSIIRDILIIHDAKEYTKKAYKPDY